LAQGEGEAASAALRRALAEAQSPLERARLLPAVVEVALETGEIDEARRSCAELSDTAALCAPGLPETVVAQASGAIELAVGNAEAALAPLRRACAEWQALGAPYEAARVRVLLGLACRGLGDGEGAALELDAARGAFERLGAAPDVRRVDRLLGHKTSTRGSHGLTGREREVLSLIATGSTNRTIASHLSISEKTVARHVANIFTKLNVTSRAAATAYAYRNGLVESST
jgi:DNA-binding CsgD family transcriptional regulator